MKEAYVSYEIAKLLKEKGFDEPCKSYFIDYVDYVDYFYSTEELTDLHMGVWETLRPTHQMAMAWLREMHNIFIEIIIFHENMIHYRFKILNRNCEKIYIDSGSQFSYEEAVEAALKYVLENLL